MPGPNWRQFACGPLRRRWLAAWREGEEEIMGDSDQREPCPLAASTQHGDADRAPGLRTGEAEFRVSGVLILCSRLCPPGAISNEGAACQARLHDISDAAHERSQALLANAPSSGPDGQRIITLIADIYQPPNPRNIA
jgi:hypothetical protein